MYKKYLKDIYEKYGIEKYFRTDYEYLKNSIGEINSLWNENIKKVDNVKLIILAEAPMWGKEKKYFYNPTTNHSQFFYRSDLEYIIGELIENKIELISKLNETGIVIIDFSSFPFNPEKTKLSYKCDDKGRSKKIKKSDYKDILINTFFKHLKRRLEEIKVKPNDEKNIRICYRYCRVKSNLNNILKYLFLQEGFEMINYAVSISMNGGGIDKQKLNKEITQANKGIIF